MTKERALVRIQSILKLRTTKEARQFCTQVKQFGGKQLGNTQIADCLEANWKPGIDPRFIAEILKRGHKAKKSNKPAPLMSRANKKLMSRIAEALGLTVEEADQTCREIQATANSSIPLKYIASAAEQARKNEELQSISHLAKLAQELYIKAKSEITEKQFEEMKRKDARVRNLPALPKQPLPKYVLDESGFIIRNPQRGKGDKSD